MKRYVIHALLVLDVMLACALLWMWFDAQGNPRHVHWAPPAAIKPDFSGLKPTLAGPGQGDDGGRIVATLDRPLFSPSRRPPPPPVVVVAPPPDPLANTQLLGVYGGAQGGGVIARVDGKVRRARINEKIGEWTITQIADRDVTFTRSGENRVIRLAGRRPPGSAATPAAPAAAVAPSPAPSQMTGAQRVEEENRERLRYLNELNARNGLPPITNR